MNRLLVIGIIIFVLIDILLIVYVFSKRKRVPVELKRVILLRWAEIGRIQDKKMQVVEAEKVLDYVLKAKGYTGSFGDKLKRLQREKQNVQALWVAHKKRNEIAHDIHVTLEDKSHKKAMDAYKVMIIKNGIPLR